MSDSIDRNDVIEALRGIDSQLQRVRDRITIAGPSSVLAVQEECLEYCYSLVRISCGVSESELREVVK